MAWTSLCSRDELKEDQGHYAEIEGFHLAVFLHNGSIFCMDNLCPHAGGSMSAGFIEDGCAVCPWHFWAFRLDTGELRGNEGFGLRTYKIRLLERAGQPTLVQADLPMP